MLVIAAIVRTVGNRDMCFSRHLYVLLILIFLPQPFLRFRRADIGHWHPVLVNLVVVVIGLAGHGKLIQVRPRRRIVLCVCVFVRGIVTAETESLPDFRGEPKLVEDFRDAGHAEDKEPAGHLGTGPEEKRADEVHRVRRGGEGDRV